MTTVTVAGGRLELSVEGADRMWALRSHLSIPLEHIRGARVDPDVARRFKGLRLAGTHLPGILAAGTFRQDGEWVFWDVHEPDRTVVVELEHEHYGRLCVEVEDPEASVALIRRAIGA